MCLLFHNLPPPIATKQPDYQKVDVVIMTANVSGSVVVSNPLGFIVWTL